MIGALYHGDCRTVLQAFDRSNQREIRPNSVDLIATDPPYFIDGMGDDWSHKRLNARKSKGGVVKGLPVGMKFDRRQSRRLYDFFQEVAALCYDVLKPGAFMCVFAQGRLYHAVAMAADDAGFEIKDMLAWRYDRQPKGFSLRHFVKKMAVSETEKSEILLKIGDRRTPQLRPQFDPILLAQKPREGSFIDNFLKWQVGLINPKVGADGLYPSTVSDIKQEPNQHIDHMTVKPVALMERLIDTFTTADEITQTVLDPFVGSGTTAVAAYKLGRNFIGIDTEMEYIRTARRRLQAMGCQPCVVTGYSDVPCDHALHPGR